MNQKTIILVVVLFVLIIGGMFLFANFRKAEIEQQTPPTTTPPTTEEVPYPEITRVDAKHYYIDGVHTLAGELLMPTPCDLLETEATVMESYPEQIVIDFSVINTADTCAQVVTAQRFKVDATASAEADFTARFMGREIELNLIPAPEGEVPEEFELYLKG